MFAGRIRAHGLVRGLVGPLTARVTRPVRAGCTTYAQATPPAIRERAREITTADVIHEKPLKPLEMQVLVAVSLGDSLAADVPHRIGTEWLSRALGLELRVVDEIVDGLEQANLVRRSREAQDVREIEYELAEKREEGAIAAELPVAVTPLGLQTVESWLSRTRRHFRSWPPERPDADDAVG